MLEPEIESSVPDEIDSIDSAHDDAPEIDADRRHAGRFEIIAGIVMITVALIITGYNLWDSRRAGLASETILQEVAIPSELRKAPDTALWQYTSNVSGFADPVEMPMQEVSGSRCIGVLEVPEYQLKLPVLCDWDYDKLELAPCVYTGSYETGDLVICGHNYPTHFSRLKYIPLGSDVYLTTVDGYVYHYTVDNLETIQSASVEEMISADNWDLTLFTCHTGGQTRCAVRCIQVDD